jgi:hypothetical protein
MDLCVDWEFWGNLPIQLSLGERIFINLSELWREKDFKSIMGAKRRTRFLELNLCLYLTLFLNDFSGKGMGAWNQCSFVNNHKTNELLKGSQESYDPLKSLVYILNIVKKKTRTSFALLWFKFNYIHNKFDVGVMNQM